MDLMTQQSTLTLNRYRLSSVMTWRTQSTSCMEPRTHINCDITHTRNAYLMPASRVFTHYDIH